MGRFFGRWDMQHAINLIAYDCTASAEDGAVCVTENYWSLHAGCISRRCHPVNKTVRVFRCCGLWCRADGWVFCGVLKDVLPSPHHDHSAPQHGTPSHPHHIMPIVHLNMEPLVTLTTSCPLSALPLCGSSFLLPQYGLLRFSLHEWFQCHPQTLWQQNLSHIFRIKIMMSDIKGVWG